jgi:Family of unknown function (DUF6789)
MTVKGWIWKAVIAGSCGTTVHFIFMYFRTRNGVLPSFQPYQAFQFALSQWVGTNVPAIVPWALSFVNGMTILGFLFAWFNRLLPGRNGALKGIDLRSARMGVYEPNILSSNWSWSICHAGRTWYQACPAVAFHGADIQRGARYRVYDPR